MSTSELIPVHALTKKPVADPGDSFPSSSKVYVTGSRPDIRVPFRKIALSPTPGPSGVEDNPPHRVYDTSGSYTDPAIEVDVEKGLAPLRRDWITGRGDVELVSDAET